MMADSNFSHTLDSMKNRGNQYEFVAQKLEYGRDGRIGVMREHKCTIDVKENRNKSFATRSSSVVSGSLAISSRSNARANKFRLVKRSANSAAPLRAWLNTMPGGMSLRGYHAGISLAFILSSKSKSSASGSFRNFFGFFSPLQFVHVYQILIGWCTFQCTHTVIVVSIDRQAGHLVR